MIYRGIGGFRQVFIIAVMALALAPDTGAAMGGAVGAGKGDAAPQTGADTPLSTLETDAGVYTFTVSDCGIYVDEGVYDIEASGPGTAPDGEDFFFGLSTTANAITLELGTDTAFSSSDRTLQAGRVVTQEFEVVVEDRMITVFDLALVDEDFKPVHQGATLTIYCK